MPAPDYIVKKVRAFTVGELQTACTIYSWLKRNDIAMEDLIRFLLEKPVVFDGRIVGHRVLRRIRRARAERQARKARLKRSGR
jgi:hypothetical protein